MNHIRKYIGNIEFRKKFMFVGLLFCLSGLISVIGTYEISQTAIAQRLERKMNECLVFLYFRTQQYIELKEAGTLEDFKKGGEILNAEGGHHEDMGIIQLAGRLMELSDKIYNNKNAPERWFLTILGYGESFQLLKKNMIEVETMLDICRNNLETSNEIIDLEKKFIEQYRKIAKNSALFSSQLGSELNFVKNMVFNVTLLFAIAALTTLFLLIKMTVRPLLGVTSVARELAGGDLDQEIDIQQEDEIGQLALSFKKMQTSLRERAEVLEKIAEGNLDVSVEEKSDNDRLAISVNRMTRSLKETSEENERNNWFKTGQAQLADQMRGNKDIPTLSRDIISCLAGYLNIQVGTFYVADREEILRLAGSYAFTRRKGIVTKIKHGEGLVGEAALEKQSILISDVPEDYMRVDSSLGNTLPRNILAVPVILQGAVMGVMELGSLRPFTDRHMEFVELVTENIAIAINTAKESRRTKVLLEETQSQAEELQAQQEELKVSNEQLQAQQEELRVSNEELGNKTRVLEAQKEEIEKNNRSLALAKEDLTKKARELAVSSKYKSEFLANMSHELRTPLNSLLILSRDLAENSSGNLTEEQVESAKIVHNSGQGLLSLINDILDLSKIEAGKMQVSFDNIKLDEIEESILTNFRHVLDKKNLELRINLSREIRPVIQTDRQKLEQIIKNLISNSSKFTESGGITVDFGRTESHVDLSRSGLKPEDAIAISVIDTGIGIPEDKQLEIFEAFQQADGSISRKYGGTGLGLSISRELVNLLGGEIKLQSEVGKGSTFTVYLPFVCKKTVGHQEEERVEKQKKREKPEEQKRLINPQTFSSIPDDRDELEEGDKVILIIEDDPVFARSIQDQAGGHRFKTLVSSTGEEGVELARKHIPEAVVLDINLPGIDGWAVLDTLKDDPDLRHIPIHIVSSEDENLDAYKKGAIEYLEKPVSREQLSSTFQQIESFNEKRVKDLLLVEDDENMRKSIIKLIGNSDVATTEAATGDAAIAALKTRGFDCMVLDLRLPDITGTELLQKMNDDKKIKIPPVIIYTGKDLTSQEVEELQHYSDSIIIKGAKSEERLLDETALFLHRVVKNMPGNQQKMIARLHDKEQIFRNQKVLLVDDDMRNVFALAKVLNKKGIRVEKAENGKKALAVLEKEDDIGLVLMDIMMPVMDGYETIERIRSQQKFNELPIIALTAKAMASDREKCVAVGANDYISKPVDVDRLLSLMRIWLYRDPLS